MIPTMSACFVDDAVQDVSVCTDSMACIAHTGQSDCSSEHTATAYTSDKAVRVRKSQPQKIPDAERVITIKSEVRLNHRFDKNDQKIWHVDSRLILKHD